MDLFLSVGDFFGDSNPRHVLEDVYDGLYQLGHNPELAGAFSLTVISIGKFRAVILFDREQF